MNDTTMIGAAGQVEDVRAYVPAVRAWLADLPADEVEELTAGMEADLAERAAESGGPLGGLLGQPEAYAAELRSAAGLPAARRRGGAGCRAARAVDRPPGARARTSSWPGIRGCASCDRPGGWPRGAVAGWVARRGARHRSQRCCSRWSGRRCRCGWGWCCVAGSHWARVLGSHSRPRTRSPSSCSCRCWRPTRPGRPGSPTRRRSSSRGSVAGRRQRRAGHRTSTPTTPPATGSTTCACSTSRAAALVVGPTPCWSAADPDRPMRSSPARRTSRAVVFPMRLARADPGQDPGFGWTPPLAVPPAGAASRPHAGTTSLGEPEPVGHRLAERSRRARQHAEQGRRSAAGRPAAATGAGAPATVTGPPWPNWQRQAT